VSDRIARAAGTPTQTIALRHGGLPALCPTEARAIDAPGSFSAAAAHGARERGSQRRM